MKKVIVILIVMFGGLGVVVWQLQSTPEGPQQVAWDQATCAHCQMHLGDPRFAAQLQTQRGEVHHFDDAGCLFEFVEKNDLEVASTYFRHYRRDAWIGGGEVRFVEVDEPTPMGYGLAAVTEKEAPDGRSYERARREITSSENAPDERRRKHRHEEAHR